MKTFQSLFDLWMPAATSSQINVRLQCGVDNLAPTPSSIMLLQAIPFSVKLPTPLSLISLNFNTHYIYYLLLILGWSLSYSFFT